MKKSLQLIKKMSVVRNSGGPIQTQHYRHYDSGKLALVNKGFARPISTSGVRLVATAKPLIMRPHIHDKPSILPVIALRPRMRRKVNDNSIPEGYGSCGRDCQVRVRMSYDSRMEDISRLMDSKNKKIPEDGLDLRNYALSVDYVEPGTYSDERRGFVRYQISWGGPQDEFRFFDDGKVEYWFLDWNDGAKIDVPRHDADIVKKAMKYDRHISLGKDNRTYYDDFFSWTKLKNKVNNL